MGHYSIWLTNEVQEMLAYISDVLPGAETAHMLDNWTNINLYLPSNEVSGVLPIPSDVQHKFGMAEYQPSLHSLQLQSFLASR